MQTLRLVFTGHIDHGKSTLIGRLLYDTGCLPEDRIDEIRRASEREGRPMEFAFAMDHLREERSRGITIDTAQLVFRTGRREVIIIDAPGHKEFLKNMLTGASLADAAVLVVDANEGIREQTRRHAYLLHLLGIRRVVAVINKMDLVGWSADRFDELKKGLMEFGGRFDLEFAHFIPVCAPCGDGIARRADDAPWYSGPTLLEVIDVIEAAGDRRDSPLALPVQDVYTHAGPPVAVGLIADGTVTAGQEVIVLPGGGRVTVDSLAAFPQARSHAVAGESIGLRLSSCDGIARGAVLVGSHSPARAVVELNANLFWLGPINWTPDLGLNYECCCQVVELDSMQVLGRLDSSTLDGISDVSELAQSEVARVRLRPARPVAAAPFADLPELGRFVLTHRGRVVAGGIITRLEPVPGGTA